MELPCDEITDNEITVNLDSPDLASTLVLSYHRRQLTKNLTSTLQIPASSPEQSSGTVSFKSVKADIMNTIEARRVKITKSIKIN